MKKNLKIPSYIFYLGIMLISLLFQEHIFQRIPESFTLQLNTAVSDGIKIADFLQVTGEEQEAYCISHKMTADIGRQGCEVKKVLVNAAYMTEQPLELIAGQNINQDMTNNHDRVAVIGRELALKLFFSLDVLGRSILIDDTQYKIIGIYENKTIPLVQDIYHRIYIPYSSVNDWENLPIDTIGIGKGRRQKELLESLRFKMGENLHAYQYEDYGEWKRASKQGVKVLNILLGTIIVYLIFSKLSCLLKKWRRDIKQKLKRYYPKTMIRKYYRQIIKGVLLVMIGLGVVVVLWILLRFPLIIPTELIPEENIFDFSYYWQVIIEKIRLHNSNVLTGEECTYRSLIYYNLLNVITFCVGVNFILKARREKVIKDIDCTKFIAFGSIAICIFVGLYVISVDDGGITIILMIILFLLRRTNCNKIIF